LQKYEKNLKQRHRNYCTAMANVGRFIKALKSANFDFDSSYLSDYDSERRFNTNSTKVLSLGEVNEQVFRSHGFGKHFDKPSAKQKSKHDDDFSMNMSSHDKRFAKHEKKHDKRSAKDKFADW